YYVAYYVYRNPNILKRAIVKSYFIFHSIQKTIEKIDILSKKFQDQTHTVGLPSFAPGYEKNVWDKSLFDETIELPFEDIMISVPLHYDEVLRHEYGDYMSIPENKMEGSEHGKCYFDCDKSYLEYKNISKEEFDKMLFEQKI
ncbi:MAG: LicD family protein, partial [Anaeroplasmataceae bacterium]|nr:LicD family protein [Anaeroplasmataceae bacterium]